MDVGGWLRRLGLEQYEAAFRENNVDETLLPSLTAEDLKELGIGSISKASRQRSLSLPTRSTRSPNSTK
jgi:hypothetical protein